MSLKTLRFEALGESRLPEVLEIEARSHKSPWSEASFRMELGHPAGIFLLAIVDGKVAGYGGCWVLVDEAHITNVVVAEERRRQGLGLRLMKEILHRACERGAVCATLEVRAGNAPAIALYEGMGFLSAGLRKAYYPDKEDAVIMWLHDLSGFA
jgi:ribosomal-protein-alanine N-acetyltransferase